jgi:O-antigen/teichoic acid export membrane protein
MVGEFSLALAIATPVMVLSQMQLRQILVTDAHQQVPFADYFWTRLVAGLCGLILIMGLGAVLRHDPALRMLTIALAIARLAESLSDILNGSLQRREHMGLVAVSMTVRGLAGLVALAIALKVTASIYAAAAMALASDVACVRAPRGLAAGPPERRAPRVHLAPSVLVRMVRDSATLTIAAGLLSLSAGIPRYFLDYSSGKAAVAILAVAMMPISLMGLFTGAVSQATLARASLPACQTADRLRVPGAPTHLFNFFVGLCLVVLLAVAGRQLVHFLYTGI